MEPIWQIEYEESPLSELWVYKHDANLITDGAWHRLNSRSKAEYRVEGDRMQLVIPDSEFTDADWTALLAALAKSAFMTDEGSPEVMIIKRQDGFAMTSHWVYLSQFAEFQELTRDAIRTAYARLLELEAQELS